MVRCLLILVAISFITQAADSVMIDSISVSTFGVQTLPVAGEQVPPGANVINVRKPIFPVKS